MKPSTASWCCLLGALVWPTSIKAQRPQRFHWDWHKSQELDAAQSLRNAKIPKREKQAIAEAITILLRPILANMRTESQAELDKDALDTRIELIDLNHNGVPEVIAQSTADCSATGNCSFWVLQKVHRKYEPILEGFGQTFTVQKTSTHGYRDIVVSMQGSAFDSGLTVFRYEGHRYHEGACYNASWRVRVGDTFRDVKNPVVTPCN